MTQAKSKASSNHINRTAQLRWVPLALMRVSPMAQRELNQSRVDKIVANFDPEQIGTPTVNKRGDFFYIIDGQHRVEAMRDVGWGDQQLQCWTYDGLNEREEADMFLKLNDVLPVSALDRYSVGVVAGREVETNIEKILAAVGMHVGLARNVPGTLSCVGTLRRVYERSEPATLARALEIVRDSYGDAGLTAAVIDGMGYFVQRYGDRVDTDRLITKLSNAHGGVSGLLNKAEVLRRQTGNQKGICVAAAIVEVYNTTRGGGKLPNWWKAEEYIGDEE